MATPSLLIIPLIHLVGRKIISRAAARPWLHAPSKQKTRAPAAERGFYQTSGVTLTKSCRCKNSPGDHLTRHFGLIDVASTSSQ
jgi:hypothetical protein